jgi:hypothetical protein
VSVTVSQPPAVTLGSDIIACPFDTITIVSNIQGMTYSYYWSNGSDEPSIQIGSTGIGYDSKTIWLRVENDQGCSATDTVRIVFDFAQCSGVKEQTDNTDIYIYPNPTTGKVQVEWKGMNGNVKLQVSDIRGNMILDQAILAPPSGEYKGSFDLKGQPEGIYLLKLVGEDKVLVRKILLQ